MDKPFFSTLRRVICLIALCNVAFGQSIDADENLTYRGTILDENGNPIPDVRIVPNYFPYLKIRDPDFDHELLAIQTNQNGEWEWNLPSHPGISQLKAKKSGYIPKTINFQGTRQQTTVLENVPTIAGKVYPINRLNLSEASISAWTNLFSNSGFAISKVTEHPTCDLIGEFKLHNDYSKNLHIRVFQPDGYSGSIDVDKFDSSELLSVELYPPTSLSFQVNDCEGSPISDAKVSLRYWNQEEFDQWSATSDANGQLTWNFAMPGNLVFTIEKTGFRTAWKMVEVENNENIKATLLPSQSLKFRVIDAETGENIQKFFYEARFNRSVRRKDQKFNIEAKFLEGESLPVSNLPKEYEDPIRTSPNCVRGIGTDSELNLKCNFWYDTMELIILADNYANEGTSILGVDPETVKEIRMTRQTYDNSQRGMAIAPDGKPAQGVIAFQIGEGSSFSVPMSKADLLSSRFNSSKPYTITDDQGYFPLFMDESKSGVIAWGEQGWFLGPLMTNENGPIALLNPFAKIRLRLPVNRALYSQFAISKASEGVGVHKLPVTMWLQLSPEKLLLASEIEIDRAPTGRLELIDLSNMGDVRQNFVAASFDIEPESVNTIDLRGSSFISGQIELAEGSSVTTDKLQVWIKQLASPDQIERSYRANVQKDGSFELSNVWEGEYSISIPPVHLQNGNQPAARPAIRRDPFTQIQFDYRDSIEVAENSTIDLGEIEVHSR